MTRLRILVVDDEVLIADYIADVVESAGHDVVGTPGRADEAMRLIVEQMPDLAILDIKLKGERDGIDLATDIRAAKLAIPHVFISGSGDPETLRRAQATDPLAFLQKPFDSTKLLATLNQVVGNQR